MATISGRVLVTDEPTLVVAAGTWVHLRNLGSAIAYLGGPDVDVESGWPLQATTRDEPFSLQLGGALWAVTATPGETATVLYIGF